MLPRDKVGVVDPWPKISKKNSSKFLKMLPTSLSFLFTYVYTHVACVLRWFDYFSQMYGTHNSRVVDHRCAHPKYVVLLPFRGLCRYLARRQRTYMAWLNRVRPALMIYAFLSPMAKAWGCISSPCVAADIIEGVI